MLDPKEQKKGGFGAAADRERERREARDAARVPGAQNDATGATSDTPVLPEQLEEGGTPGATRADKRMAKSDDASDYTSSR